MSSRLLLVGLYIFLGIFSTEAYAVDFITESNNLILKTSPQFPGPGEVVTITAFGSNFDETRTFFTWIIDDQKVAEGVGVSSITTRTHDEKNKDLKVYAKLPNNNTISTSYSLSGNFVDLLWESEGYRNPFINIHTPLLPQAPARVVAIPYVRDNTGTLLTSDKIYYTWTFNGQKMINKSGYGKSFFYNDLSERSNTIGVSLSTVDGQILAESQTTLIRSNPEAFIYQKHPVYGELFETAFFGAMKVNEENIILKLEPIGFSILSSDDTDLMKEWVVDRKSLKDSPGSEIAVNGVSGKKGLLQIKIAHSIAKLQKAVTNIRITF